MWKYVKPAGTADRGFGEQEMLLCPVFMTTVLLNSVYRQGYDGHAAMGPDSYR